VREDRALSWPGFTARVTLVFAEMQAGWSKLDWTRVRPYLTDALFHMQLYWIRACKAAGLRNELKGTRITKIVAAKVVRDAYFDAVTVRVFATGLDYKVDAAGKVVGGDASNERPYTEYWTFVRGRGVKRAPSAEKTCPNCGAPVKIDAAGACEHCKAKVTSGRFDWVLSRIEQDDVYSG
jgi:Tim44-like domain